MSITFWAPDAPTRKVTPYEDEPDFVMDESLLPEINLSNSNAYAMLQALGVVPDYAGGWSVEELPTMIERAMKLANEEALRAPALADTVQSGGHMRQGETNGNVTSMVGTCRMISFGRDDDYVQRTALRFVELFKAAKEGSYSVHWG